MAKIFICYRRSDSAGHAGRLYDRLVTRFGKHRVYMDLDSIPLGSDFVEEIKKALSNCAAVVVLIGPQWFAGENRTRLTTAGDHVRQEIAQSLKSNAKVFPVLVHGARMPAGTELPKDIQALARKHAIDLRDVSFDTDFQQLARALERLDGLKPLKAPSSKTSQATSKRSGKNTAGTRGGPRKSARAAPSGQVTGGGTKEQGKADAGTRASRGSTAGKASQKVEQAKAKPSTRSTKTGGTSSPAKPAPAAAKKSRPASIGAGGTGGGARTSKGTGSKSGGRKPGARGTAKGGRGRT